MHSRFLSFIFSITLLGAVAQAGNTEPYYAGVSPKAEAVFVVDMNSLMASPLVKAIEQMMSQGQPPKENPDELAMGLTEHTGATKKDLGKFVLSTSDVMALQSLNGQSEPDPKLLEKAGMMMAFQFKTKISKDQFDAWLKSQTPEEELKTTKKSNVGDGVLYTDEGPNAGMAMGMLPVGDQSIIFVGGNDSVKQAMEAGKGTLPQNIAVAQTLVTSIPNIFIMASPSDKWREQLVAQAQGEDGNAAYIEDAQQFAFGLNVSDGIKLLSGVKFKNADTAKNAYTELNDAVTELQSQPMEPGNPLMMFGTVIKNLNVTEQGDEIRVATELGAMESQQMLMMLPMMLMQMQMQQGGGGMGGPQGGGMQQAPGM